MPLSEGAAASACSAAFGEGLGASGGALSPAARALSPADPWLKLRAEELNHHKRGDSLFSSPSIATEFRGSASDIGGEMRVQRLRSRSLGLGYGADDSRDAVWRKVRELTDGPDRLSGSSGGGSRTELIAESEDELDEVGEMEVEGLSTSSEEDEVSERRSLATAPRPHSHLASPSASAEDIVDLDALLLSDAGGSADSIPLRPPSMGDNAEPAPPPLSPRLQVSDLTERLRSIKRTVIG